MPHDRNGKLIQVGDAVFVRCTIQALHLSQDYCNVTLKTVIPMPPYPDGTILELNAKQVEKPEEEDAER